jgi:carboxymethylenebutenolidase
LVHEWWGLNDQIKSTARAFADAGYVALAVDLYDGKVAEDRDSARAYMQGVDANASKETLSTWLSWLRGHDATHGGIGTVGWCFGGGWSLSASLLAPVEATVVYYGRVTHTKEELSALQSPVLGHYATADKWIDQKMVAGFEVNMKALGKPFESHWYEAEHAFANPSSGRYDEADAKLSWQRTLEFFKANL